MERINGALRIFSIVNTEIVACYQDWNRALHKNTHSQRDINKQSSSTGLIGPLRQSVWWVIMTKLEVNTALYEHSQSAISHREKNDFTHLKSQMVFIWVQPQIGLIVFSTKTLMSSKYLVISIWCSSLSSLKNVSHNFLHMWEFAYFCFSDIHPSYRLK